MQQHIKAEPQLGKDRERYADNVGKRDAVQICENYLDDIHASGEVPELGEILLVWGVGIRPRYGHVPDLQFRSVEEDSEDRYHLVSWLGVSSCGMLLFTDHFVADVAAGCA